MTAFSRRAQNWIEWALLIGALGVLLSRCA